MTTVLPGPLVRISGALVGALLALFSMWGSSAAAPRYAIVNAGTAEEVGPSLLLRLYEHLAPASASAADSRPAPATKPSDPTAQAARPRAREASGARPREATRNGPRGDLPTPVQGKALRRALAGYAHDESLGLAREALARGRRLFTALQREAAAEAFVQAIAVFDRHVSLALGRPSLVSAHTYLLLCQHELGRTEAARVTAGRLRELTGNQRPAGVPQATWDAYPLEATPLLPRRALEVKAPPGAQVFLDDALAGAGPTVLHVGPGAHRVRVELKGHRVFVQEVPPATQGIAVPVTLVPEPEDPFEDVRRSLGAVRTSGKPFEAGPYKGLAKTLSVDFLLVAVPEGAQVRLRWFSRNLGRFSGDSFAVTLRAQVPPEGRAELEALRSTVMASFTKAREEVRKDEDLARRAEKKGEDTKKNAGPQIWKKWYFWVAAAVVAGVVAAFAIKDSLDEEKVILKITRE